MQITVIPPGRQGPQTFPTRFVLKRDTFNDYGFLTRYELYRDKSPEGESRFLVGTVKILRMGQTSADSHPVTEDIKDRLGPSYCSVGASLDYYVRLNTLPKDERDALLLTLRDVVANPELVKQFENEDGWTTSLFRKNDFWRQFLEDGEALYKGNFAALSDVETVFSFHPRNSKDSIRFQLGAPMPDFYFGPKKKAGLRGREYILPERVLVLIGRNGSGKSTLLTDLAHVAFASPEERTRKNIRSKGKLEPNGIGFFRVITISYSAFDSFELPGTSDADSIQVADDVLKGEGRFVYCGLRDIAAETKSDAANDTSDNRSIERTRAISGSRRTTMLKSLDQLADEFAMLVRRIASSPDKVNLLGRAMQPLFADPSFAGLNIEKVFEPAEARDHFLEWSTGHKIALHVVVSLAAHVSRNSLVLFDEPEMHLHPPLTAALMHAVRIILAEVDAFCVVATHSPVVLQETLAQHVRYMDRVADEVSISSPHRETFGENVGILTYDAFGLTAASTDFHESLDMLVEGGQTLDEIEALFTNGLSSQALAYVLSKLAGRGKAT